MRLLTTYRETIADGPGFRYAIYLAGCKHACPGCHNEASWDANAGIELSEAVLSDIIQQIRRNPLLDGITISGGDPFFSPRELCVLLKRLRAETQLNIWCYTGYTIEYILDHEEYKAALEYIDVLVDGLFVQKLRDPRLRWRGSSNQRLICIPHDRPISLETIQFL